MEKPPIQSVFNKALHIAVLWAFAVAQPLFDLLGKQAGYFTAAGHDALDVVLLSALLMAGIPAALILIKELPGLLVPGWRHTMQLILVAVLVALIVMPALIKTPLPAVASIVVALLLGILIAVLYHWQDSLHKFISILWPVVVIFPLVFLLVSDAKQIVFKKADAPTTEQSVNIDTTKKYPPVVMVIFDELPASTLLDKTGTIDTKRYPNFSALAAQSHWFKNTYTVGGSTLYAVPALLSGKFPGHDTVHTEQELSVNLFTLLQHTHTFKNVIEKYTTLCPKTLCKSKQKKRLKALFKSLPDLAVVYLHTVAPKALAASLPDVSNNWSGFAWQNAKTKPAKKKAPQPATVTDAKSQPKKETIGIDLPTTRKGKKVVAGHKWGLFEKFIGKIKPLDGNDKPPLHLMHIVFPHVPYNYMPSGKYYRMGPYKYFTTWQNQRQMLFDMQRYLLQLGAADTMLGNLIDQLKETGLYDDALIVVVADHGANWSAVGDERRMMTSKNQPDMVRVPMLLKLPNQSTPQVIQTPVRTIDLLPTLATKLGLPLPGAIDGHDMFAPDYPNYKIVDVMDNLGKTRFTVQANRNFKTPSWQTMMRWFGDGNTENGLYLKAPCSPLHGKPIDSKRVTQSSNWQFELANPEHYQSVDFDDSFTPALVEALIETSDQKPLPKNPVIAVNKTIWNCQPMLVQDKNRLTIGGLVPEKAFQSGINTVQVYDLNGTQLTEIPQR